MRERRPSLRRHEAELLYGGACAGRELCGKRRVTTEDESGELANLRHGWRGPGRLPPMGGPLRRAKGLPQLFLGESQRLTGTTDERGDAPVESIDGGCSWGWRLLSRGWHPLGNESHLATPRRRQMSDGNGSTSAETLLEPGSVTNGLRGGHLWRRETPRVVEEAPNSGVTCHADCRGGERRHSRSGGSGASVDMGRVRALRDGFPPRD